MATFLSAPLKTTDEVDLVKPLSKYIENTFEQLKKEEWSPAIAEFNKLRSQVITKMVDRHESALDVLFRYHDQLCVAETKLPITENQIRVNFTWYDAFDKGSIFGRKKLSMSSASYEKMAILYQIGAVQSQLAEDQNTTSDDGLKSAAKYFQSASGIFNHLREVTSTYVNDPTPDLTRDVLMTLSFIMHAQAQDCFCRKARHDKMKDGTIAKIANYTAELYNEACRQAGMQSVKAYWPKDWLPHLNSRHQAYLALTQYYQALDCGSNNKYGEQVARLRRASQLMGESKKACGNLIAFPFTKEQAFIDDEKTRAEKDNKLIYHDKEPSVAELSPVGKAFIAKPTVPSDRFCGKIKDLFAGIVPVAVHNAMTTFENMKAGMVNMEIGRMREATQLMNSVLSSLNLPAAVEDLSGHSLPESVLEKSTRLREMGGIDTMQTLMTDLPELLARNKEILDECTRLLNEEQGSDQQLRQQFAQRWTRKKSEELTQPIRAEGHKYQTIIDGAMQADHMVKEKYTKLSVGITLLSKTPQELQSTLPSANSATSLKDSGPVQTLRQMLAQVEKIKAEREELESSLKDQRFDLAGKFLGALAADGVVGEEMICREELDTVYGPLRAEVSASLAQQNEVLATIQQANTEFCQAKQSDQSSAERERLLKEMAEAFDRYVELKSNLEEGTKFYNDLTQMLVKYQSKIRDFCFARKTEKDDLMSDLQQAIANRPTEAAPKVPTYKATPPERPPPPNVPPPSSSMPAQNYQQAPAAHSYPQTAPSTVGAAGAQGGTPYSAAPPYPYAPYAPQQMPTGYNPYAAYGQAPHPYGQAPQPYGQAPHSYGQPYGGAPNPYAPPPAPGAPGAHYGAHPSPGYGYPQQQPQQYPGPPQPYPTQPWR